jgi:protein-tyrosine phosphatase
MSATTAQPRATGDPVVDRPMSAGPGQRLRAVPGLYNVRDLGGLPLVGGGATTYGRVIRGDSTRTALPETDATLLALGVRTVLDLRSQMETASQPGPLREHADVDWHNAEMLTDDNDLDPDLQRYGTLRQVHRGILDRAGQGFRTLFAVLADSPQPVVYLHCHGGKDRTGLATAVLLRLAGVDDVAIAEDFALTGYCLAPYIAQQRAARIAKGGDVDRFDVLQDTGPAVILAALQYLDEEYGGPEGYLTAKGIRSEQMEAVGRLLTNG